MLGRILVFAFLCRHIPADSVTYLKAALAGTNGSFENGLSIGHNFAKFGKDLKLRISNGHVNKLDLMSLESRLDRLKEAVIQSEPTLRKSIEDLDLLENVEKPLLDKWKQLLDLLKTPTSSLWEIFVKDCKLRNPRCFMKRLRLNIERIKSEIVEQRQNYKLNDSIIKDVRRAVQGRMFLTISLVHLCGAAIHGDHFNETFGEDVTYMNVHYPRVLELLRMEKLLTAENVEKTTTPNPNASEKETYNIHAAGIGGSVRKPVLKWSQPTTLSQSTRGERFTTPFSEKMNVDVDIDVMREFVDHIRRIENTTIHTEKIFSEIDSTHSENRQFITRMRLQYIATGLLPLKQLIENFINCAEHPYLSLRKTIIHKCEDDLPREIMSLLYTYTNAENSTSLRGEIILSNFDEIYMKQWMTDRKKTLQITATVHRLCRNMLLGDLFDEKTDPEIAHVQRVYDKTYKLLMAMAEWRSDNYFYHVNGVEGVIRRMGCSKSVTYNNSQLSNAIRDELHTLYPSHQWLVLVYSGVSVINKNSEGVPSIKCDSGASRHVEVANGTNVFVVRTKKYTRKCHNGCFRSSPRDDRTPTRLKCLANTFLSVMGCETLTEPSINFPEYACYALVKENVPVGISGTEQTDSTRDHRGTNACRYGCSNTFSLLISDSDIENTD